VRSDASCASPIALRRYRRTGTEAQAGTHFTTASAMYGEMGMTTWLEKLETG
jgi:hypothetical protein